jgi:2,4-dienoyl-CoA reductase (NADPH2)
MQNPHFPLMLAPLKLKHGELKNRIIMGAMHTRIEAMPDGAERLGRFYAERAKGGVGLIITGGHAPNKAGHLEPNGPILDDQNQLDDHRIVTRAVHEAGGKIFLQILHAGRYGATFKTVAPSAIRAPISPLTPKELEASEIEQTIKDFAQCAALAQQAGYDGVEIMGSEGYLINQFTAPRTNKRDDQWGGSPDNRHRFPIEIIQATRAATSDDFILMYRISSLELVEDGATGEEIITLAKKVETAGADILSTGIGWHEARIPTIAYMVPRGTWGFAAKRMKEAVSIPVVASNRLNTPQTVEDMLAGEQCDLAYLARPMLADPEFVNKAAAGKADEINVCIACNQACLDYIFKAKAATCLVNPRAGHEFELRVTTAPTKKRIAVIGGGAAGMAATAIAGARGHAVTLFEAGDELGGQLQLARQVPGKDEFNELLRYFNKQLEAPNVEVKTGVTAKAVMLRGGKFDEIIIATGVVPRKINLDGIDHESVVSYPQILSGEKICGDRVLIIGAGGIGFDVADFLSTKNQHEKNPIKAFLTDWGVDQGVTSVGGLSATGPSMTPCSRQITLMQRTPGKPGKSLGLTTGWALTKALKRRGVKILTGITYERIDDDGLHIEMDGEKSILPADTIVICAGQESRTSLHEELSMLGVSNHVIGGAAEAGELDALRAISQGYRLALTL